MRLLTLLLAGIGLFLFSLSPGFAEEKGMPSDSLAVIENKSITVGDFKAEMERLGRGHTGSFSRPEQREELLNSMVRTEMMYAAALKEGSDRKPETLELIKRIIINQYRREKLEPDIEKIRVQEDESKAYYDGHQSEFMTPEMVRAAVIRISVPKKAPEEAKKELLKRAGEARAEALKLGPETLSFGGVAVKYSDDQVSRYRGGDTGLLNKAEAGTSRWEKPVLDTIFSLKAAGEVSPVVKGADGYYLVKLMETKQGAVRPFEEVKEMIRSKLLAEKKSRIEKVFYEGLAGKVKVKTDPELLKTIGPPGGGKRPEPPPLPGK